MTRYFVPAKKLGRVALAGLASLALGVQFTQLASASDYPMIESAQGCFYGSYSTYIAGDC